MAAINDLISQIQDPELRERIQKEVNKLAKQKKFGLVFEDHMPECTPLYDMPIKRGCNVMLRDSKEDKTIYVVLKIDDDTAICVKRENQDAQVALSLNEIVRVAEFGEPIYPYLQLLDSVCNAQDSNLWHTLIEADNYHALQLLEYLYAGKVDCIYIDPPYNSGAKDWKYNNDYVDGVDSYRHSKWLSFMEKRLKLAKKLLNPKDSVLIITIDEKEYLHLGCLLEEMFPEARIQMISDVINPKGVARSGFRRNDEYIYFVMLGSAMPARIALGTEWSSSATLANTQNATSNNTVNPDWTSMMRRGSHSSRQERPGLYYPIYVSAETKTIKEIGTPLPLGQHKGNDIDGLIQVLPIRTNGEEGCWQVGPEELKNRIEQGRIRLGRETSYGYVINYLPDGAYRELLTERWIIDGRAPDGSLIAHYVGDNDDEMIAPTQWKIASHNASENGSSLLQKILRTKRFAFPKSLYSEEDTLRFFVANKPNALIIDFFAGSGTTLHAVNLLNARDSGQRRCIMVTNNEVSVEESKALTDKGYRPGDEEWNNLGIARYVTWPRTVCAIKGTDVYGEPLKGNYIGSDIPMANGFAANASFFKLGFLDKTAIELGMHFKEMLPVLWMKAGAVGPCPSNDASVSNMLIYPENKFAVLVNENAFAAFEEELAKYPEIQTVFLATDYDVNYRAMVKNLHVANTYQLYRDYLDHFRLNMGRS